MSKYTPGPWRFVEREVLEDGSIYPRHIVGGNNDLQIALLETPMTAERVNANPGSYLALSEFTINNARLIAAAPDGLAIAELTYLALLQREDIWRVHHQHIYCGLRDFIAKATGREAEDVQNDFESRAAKEKP